MRFDDCIGYVLENEGGWVMNPADPGGATNMGITLKLFSSLYPNQTILRSDLEKLTVEGAKQIYFNKFWSPLHLDEVQSDTVATAILDMSVNQGPNTAVKLAQAACGFTICDGIMGPSTVAKLNATDAHVFIYLFMKECVNHYLDLNMPVFIKGWLARVLKMYSLILKV